MASASFSAGPREQRIARALEEVDVTGLDLWNDLDALSTHTRIEAVEVPPEGVITRPDGHFTAIMNLYVVLQYGSDKDEDGFATGDSFLAKLSGRLTGDMPIVEESSVDTSSFYE